MSESEKGPPQALYGSYGRISAKSRALLFFSLSGAHAEQEPELIGFHSQVSESAVNSAGGSLRGPLDTSSPAG